MLIFITWKIGPKYKNYLISKLSFRTFFDIFLVNVANPSFFLAYDMEQNGKNLPNKGDNQFELVVYKIFVIHNIPD